MIVDCTNTCGGWVNGREASERERCVVIDGRGAALHLQRVLQLAQRLQDGHVEVTCSQRRLQTVQVGRARRWNVALASNFKQQYARIYSKCENANSMSINRYESYSDSGGHSVNSVNECTRTILNAYSKILVCRIEKYVE